MKKIISILLIVITMISLYGCNEIPDKGHDTNASLSFTKHIDYVKYVLTLKYKAKSLDTSKLHPGDQMLLERTYYYAPQEADLNKLQFISNKSIYIATSYTSTNGDKEDRILIKWTISDDGDYRLQNRIKDAEPNEILNIEGIGTVICKEIPNQEGEIYRKEYNYVYDGYLFMLSSPIWLVEDITNQELSEFLIPKKIMIEY